MKVQVVVFACLLTGFVYSVREPLVEASSQAAQAGQPAQAGQAGQPGQAAPAGAPTAAQIAQRMGAYPERPKAPQEVLDRGKAVYGVSCSFCHGSDAGGGESGPNLLRSSVVLEDQNGELVSPIVHGARASLGMPRIDITDAQIVDVVAWLHSLKVASRTGPPEVPINIVTGDSKVGEATFGKLCSSCHSVTGDLKGFAAMYKDPRAMQQAWMLPGGAGGFDFGQAPGPTLNVKPTGVTVTLADGKKVEGSLVRIDDFYVSLRDSAGSLRSFSRDGDTPKVELHDTLAAHRQMFMKITDKEIHDITAYLVTTK